MQPLHSFATAAACNTRISVQPQLRRDLEDQEAATQDALRRAVAEEVKREDMVRRLRAEQVRQLHSSCLCEVHSDVQTISRAQPCGVYRRTVVYQCGGDRAQRCRRADSRTSTRDHQMASTPGQETDVLPVALRPQASLEKKLKAANLTRRNADRANELAAVMRQVPPCCLAPVSCLSAGLVLNAKTAGQAPQEPQVMMSEAQQPALHATP